ncbi:MAG: phosphate/phosphite/phosphonate ABC transporter substrate-binding protein [Holophagales bacterium]|nr:phosphate/phosphite/phosphonate ABC transporter substrate-binding protein [Holophagales bacterium]
MLVLLVAGAAGAPSLRSAPPSPEPLAFGVLNQRSVSLTAEYWNPILEWVSRRSGVSLRLRMGKTATETTRMTVQGEFAFVYTNHLFSPERVRLGYRVLARADTEGIQGAVVVRSGSGPKSLAGLRGKTVVFPSEEAFAGFLVPMDALVRAGVDVSPVFAGNQEGALAQLFAGRADAAGVNSSFARDYARRAGMTYGVLWASETYPDLCVMARPDVPAAAVEAVRRALVSMARDPEGGRILSAGATLLNLPSATGFVESDDVQYEPYRRFYRTTLVKE